MKFSISTGFCPQMNLKCFRRLEFAKIFRIFWNENICIDWHTSSGLAIMPTVILKPIKILHIEYHKLIEHNEYEVSGGSKIVLNALMKIFWRHACHSHLCTLKWKNSIHQFSLNSKCCEINRCEPVWLKFVSCVDSKTFQVNNMITSYYSMKCTMNGDSNIFINTKILFSISWKLILSV